MHNFYRDILDRISEPPLWFDERGVPRYCEFHPGQLGNIYAREAALAEISCQGCGAKFRVALDETYADARFSLRDVIRLHRVDYGDPPNVRCCDAGPSMTSKMHAVLEYWFRDFEIDFDWHRSPALEGSISECRLEFADTVTDVVTASCAGATKILVICTSHRNRADLAGRIAAVMAVAADRRVSIVNPEHGGGVTKRMFSQHLPDAEVGSVADRRRVSLANLTEARHLRTRRNDVLVVISGPPSKVINPDPPPHIVAEEDLWIATAERFSSGSEGCIRIELALPHSRTLLAYPDIVIDASRLSRSQA